MYYNERIKPTKERKYYYVSYVQFQCQFFNKVFEIAFDLPAIIYFTMLYLKVRKNIITLIKDQVEQYSFTFTVCLN